jgi:biotin carboxyl carrier protein
MKLNAPAAQKSAAPSPSAPAQARPASASAGAANTTARLGALLALQARALSQSGFRGAAAAIAARLAASLACERVSIGFYARSRMNVHAISNTTDFHKRQGSVRAIAAAMEEAFDQQVTIVHPTPRGLSPKATLAHARLAELGGSAAVCTVLIAEKNRVLGAITLERRGGFDAATMRFAEDVAIFVGPVLELKLRIDAPLGSKLLQMASARGKRLTVPELSIGKLLLIAGAAGLLFAAWWPSPFRVIAPARVEGAVQRVVAAPIEGFLREVHVRPGERVTAGQVLATLEDRDLGLDSAKWEAEIAQLEKQYREALSKDDAAQIVVAKAKLEQAHTQLGLTTRQLERTRLRAPFDGVLISGDLMQTIGSPVKRGQELLTVTPENAFRVTVEVDEQDIGAVQTGQRGRVMFASMSDRPMDVEIQRVAPLATARDGRNFFEVEMRPDGAVTEDVHALRPGLRGVAKIDIDTRSLLAIWTYRGGNWLRRTLWRLSG